MDVKRCLGSLVGIGEKEMTLSLEYILTFIQLAVRDPEIDFALAEFVDKYNEGKIKIVND